MFVRASGLRRAAVAAGLTAVLAVGAHVAGATTAVGSSTAPSYSVGPAVSFARPWVGVLSPRSDQMDTLSGSAIRRVMIPMGWSAAEPRNGVFNSAYLVQVRNRISAAQSKGFQVVLDLGLQYPPSWVFDLPGPTRFVNQYGDVWHGPLSEDIPNAVFNPAVRAAEAGYLAAVGVALKGQSIASVRVGGLLSGEVRYPPATYNGHRNSIWSYDSLAQAGSPVPGWRPGNGTSVQARNGLTYYFASLTDYLKQLITAVSAALPHIDQEVLFPSWGLRPGMVDAAIAAGLHGTTNAEVNGMISSGLDWDSQVSMIAHLGIPATIYSTWIDAPAQGTTAAQIPPIAYLAGLAQKYGLPVAGENTGGGGSAAMALSISRTLQYHLSGMMYMCGEFIANGRAGVTLPGLITSVRNAIGTG